MRHYGNSEIGNSLLYSLQLALEEIDDKQLIVVPRDSGFNDKTKLNNAIKDLRSQGIKVIIGPIAFEEFDEESTMIWFLYPIKY